MLCGQLQLSTFVVLLNLARPVEWPENIVVASVNVNSSERLVGFVYKEAEQALKKRSLIPQKLTFRYNETIFKSDQFYLTFFQHPLRTGLYR